MKAQTTAAVLALTAVVLAIIAADRQSFRIMFAAVTFAAPAAVIMLFAVRKEMKTGIWRLSFSLLLIVLTVVTAMTGFTAVGFRSFYLLGLTAILGLVTLIFAAFGLTQGKKVAV